VASSYKYIRKIRQLFVGQLHGGYDVPRKIIRQFGTATAVADGRILESINLESINQSYNLKIKNSRLVNSSDNSRYNLPFLFHKGHYYN
jgi:hypothetical protein